MSIAEPTITSAEGSPAWKLMESMEFFFSPLSKTGCYSDWNQVFFQMKPICDESAGELSNFHMMLLQRIWVPHEYRGQGISRDVIEIILTAAKAHGVAIFAVSNPFWLSNKGTCAEDYQRIFENDEGFHYPDTYKRKQKKQRERFLDLGFQNYQTPYTRRRNRQNPRISKKDWFVYLPENMEEPYFSEIKQTMFLPYKENDNKNEYRRA